MIYFDHAATTPVDPEVLKSMEPYFAEKWGNPSSIYKIGREAKAVLEEAREEAARLLGAEKPTEIIFTSGATESNNMALKGAMEAAAFAMGGRPHIITSQIEHHSVLDTVKHLENSFGAEATYLPVNKEGLVALKDVEAAIQDNTAVISIMMGNNEMGALEPIKEIGELIKSIREKRKETGSKVPLVLHTDAVQTFAYCEVDVADLGVDLLSLTAHKFNGPKGVGLLYLRSGAKIAPQQRGGAQERNLRAGTENVPYIVGMVAAMAKAKAKAERAGHRSTITDIREYLVERITKEIPEVELLGPLDQTKRLPHIANLIFKRVEGESILINLDMLDIAASSGSACTSGSLEPSHVTKAMGYGDLEAHGAVRFSLGSLTAKSDVDELMKHLPGIIDKLRAMSPIEE